MPRILSQSVVQESGCIRRSLLTRSLIAGPGSDTHHPSVSTPHIPGNGQGRRRTNVHLPVLRDRPTHLFLSFRRPHILIVIRMRNVLRQHTQPMSIIQVPHELVTHFDILQYALSSIDRRSGSPREEERLDERSIGDRG